MLCERCKVNIATIHMEKVLNGSKTTTHLCQNCAAEYEPQISFENFFQGFLNSVFGTQELSIEELKYNDLTCQTCGLSYDEFRKTGKFGCSHCYDVFKEELKHIFKTIQGSDEHRGKIPKKSGISIAIKKETEKLRKELKTAISLEEYEKAAQIRDKVKELEGGL